MKEKLNLIESARLNKPIILVCWMTMREKKVLQRRGMFMDS